MYLYTAVVSIFALIFSAPAYFGGPYIVNRTYSSTHENLYIYHFLLLYVVAIFGPIYYKYGSSW